MDPRKANGGVFLGLNGIVIKSHGGTDAEGFAYAVDIGHDMVCFDLLAKIGQTLNAQASQASQNSPQTSPPGPANVFGSLAS
jgi:glycerol-3-phosphate acyltransferase PlsX